MSHNFNTMQVTVIYAPVDEAPWQQTVQLSLDKVWTIEAVLLYSDLYEHYPELKQTMAGAGIFGQKKALDSVVSEGDRQRGKPAKAKEKKMGKP